MFENADEREPASLGVLVPSESILSCCTRWPMDRDGPEPVHKLPRWVGSRYRLYIEERRWALTIVLAGNSTLFENADEREPASLGVLMPSESILSCCTRWPMDRDGPEPVHTLSRWVGSR